MEPIFNIRWNKVNSINFLRVGRFQFTLCLCGARSTARAFPAVTGQTSDPAHDQLLALQPILDLNRPEYVAMLRNAWQVRV